MENAAIDLIKQLLDRGNLVETVMLLLRVYYELMPNSVPVPSRALGLFVPFPRNHGPIQLQVSLPAQLRVPVLPADNQPT